MAETISPTTALDIQEMSDILRNVRAQYEKDMSWVANIAEAVEANAGKMENLCMTIANRLDSAAKREKETKESITENSESIKAMKNIINENDVKLKEVVNLHDVETKKILEANDKQTKEELSRNDSNLRANLELATDNITLLM